jgi:hypothetical protein
MMILEGIVNDTRNNTVQEDLSPLCWKAYEQTLKPSVEHGLLVEFVRDPTDDDWRIDEIVGPVGTALFIQGQVPVGPPRNPMIEILLQFRKELNKFQNIRNYSLELEYLRFNFTVMMSTE